MSETMDKPQIQPGIMDIQAYVPGKSKLEGEGPVIKLASNETPLGASPEAMAAYRDATASLERYPDGAVTALREELGALYGLNSEHIVCGAGSDEILSLLSYAYLGPGDEAIYSAHGFLMYKICILARGATPVVAPEKDYTADVDAILEKVSARTRMVFLANPNNPTGTYLPISEVARLRAGLPDNVLLVLDAAYAEYVQRNDYEAGFELVATTSNTVMTRTFSKIYGLASLRIGWAYCPREIAEVLNRIRGPFNVSAPAIAAGVAALRDKAHIEKSIAFNTLWLGKMSDALRGLGLEVTPSVGNFLLVHFPDDDTKNAAAADDYLSSKRIILRRMEAYGLPGALRLTIGTEAENDAVIKALGDFLSSASG